MRSSGEDGKMKMVGARHTKCFATEEDKSAFLQNLHSFTKYSCI